MWIVPRCCGPAAAPGVDFRGRPGALVRRPGLETRPWRGGPGFALGERRACAFPAPDGLSARSGLGYPARPASGEGPPERHVDPILNLARRRNIHDRCRVASHGARDVGIQVDRSRAQRRRSRDGDYSIDCQHITSFGSFCYGQIRDAMRAFAATRVSAS